MPETESVPVPSSPEITWGDKLEADDAQHIKERVIVVTCEPELRALLAAIDPYIDFTFTFVNGTIFRLTSESIDGPASFGRDPIPQHPTLVDPPLVLGHGAKQWIKIRQFVSRELAWAEKPLRDFRTVDGERLLLEIAKSELTCTTLAHIKAFLSGAFRYAKRQGVLNSENPMRDVVLPKAKPGGDTYAYSLERSPR
jgi:hypothetical protein